MNHTCECGHSYRANEYPLSDQCSLLVGNCPLCSSATLSLSGNPAQAMLHAVTLVELFTNAAFELASACGISDPFELYEEIQRASDQ